MAMLSGKLHARRCVEISVELKFKLLDDCFCLSPSLSPPFWGRGFSGMAGAFRVLTFTRFENLMGLTVWCGQHAPRSARRSRNKYINSMPVPPLLLLLVLLSAVATSVLYSVAAKRKRGFVLRCEGSAECACVQQSRGWCCRRGFTQYTTHISVAEPDALMSLGEPHTNTHTNTLTTLCAQRVCIIIPIRPFVRSLRHRIARYI